MTNRISLWTAAVIGAGVAGTAAALSLHRAGISTTIYEARDADAGGMGAWLTVAPNGLAVLRTLGVRELEGVPTRRMELALGDGSVLAEFPMGDDTTSVRRPELYRALREAVDSAGIAVEYGRTLRAADIGERSTTAYFEDGTQATASILVGADGIGSRVRRILDEKAPRARYLGLLNAGGFSPGVDVETAPGAMHMMFGRKTFFAWLADPNGGTWWFANPAQRAEPDRRALAAMSGTYWRERLLALVDRDDPVATTVLRGSAEIAPAWPMYDFPRVPVWHRGSAVLIGDAAHAASPSSGQGASMALEDGLALGAILGADDDTSAAFAQFEALRRPRVEKVIAFGKASSSGKAPGPMRPIRDMFLRRYFAKPRPTTDTAWLWDYRIPDLAV